MTDFLGTGWSFPIALDDGGQIRMVSEAEAVRQSIWAILGTSRGERLMRPDFGCGLHDLVFGVNNATTAAEAEAAVREALAAWEPRIDVLEVSAAADRARPELLLIEINYALRSTNSRFNLVFPFYLE